MPILAANLVRAGIKDGDQAELDLASGEIRAAGKAVKGRAFSEIQMAIYQRGGLL